MSFTIGKTITCLNVSSAGIENPLKVSKRERLAATASDYPERCAVSYTHYQWLRLPCVLSCTQTRLSCDVGPLAERCFGTLRRKTTILPITEFVIGASRKRRYRRDKFAIWCALGEGLEEAVLALQARTL